MHENKREEENKRSGKRGRLNGQSNEVLISGLEILFCSFNQRRVNRV